MNQRFIVLVLLRADISLFKEGRVKVYTSGSKTTWREILTDNFFVQTEKSLKMSFLREGLCPHLNKNNVEALRKLGIKTVVEFVAASLEETSKNTGISYKVKSYTDTSRITQDFLRV